MMMSLRITPPTTLVFLLLVYGAGAQNDWGVTYNPTSICAVKGSTVNMSCTYTHPSGYSVTKAFWTKQWPGPNREEPLDLLDDPDYRGRVQYLGDKQHNTTLRLQNVTEKDQTIYYFRFLTDQPSGKWEGAGGVNLKVTGLQVEVPERVMEGDNITLTCNTTCNLTVRTFTWYRDGQKLNSSTDQLHLKLVSREDTVKYHCSAQDQNSPEVTLNVRYGPKNVSVSISPSGIIVEGSLVTLTCSSNANPPVQNYTWFKEGGGSPVGSGRDYSFIVNSSSVGGYYCKAQNEHGSEQSAAVLLNLKGFPNVVLYVLAGLIAVCAGLFLILVVMFILRKRRARSAEEDEHGSKQENIYCNTGVRAPANVPTPASQDECAYATVDSRKQKKPTRETEEEVKYGNIERHQDARAQSIPEDDVQYASVKFSHTAPARRSAAFEDPSVIYSGVN